MAVNQFLPFGTGGGANIIDQVTYSGLAARLAGFSAGTASSAQLNKVWRQSSIISAMIGQLIADYSGADANDDGDIATLEARLIAGLRGALQSSIAGVVGQSRNAKISIPAASATATFTADELVVETALGGVRYCLASVNNTINLATTGIGGMDTGTAPANGTVAVYEMYNPSSGAKGLLGLNATSVTPGQVYSGSNAPAGYTASSLVAILQTNGSGQFKSAFVNGRKVSTGSISVLNSSSTAPSGTSLDISAVVPKGAIAISGYIATSTTSPGDATNTVTLGSDSAMNGAKTIQPRATSANGWSYSSSYESLYLAVSQTLYYAASTNASTPNFQITVSGYEF